MRLAFAFFYKKWGGGKSTVGHGLSVDRRPKGSFWPTCPVAGSAGCPSQFVSISTLVFGGCCAILKETFGDFYFGWERT